MRTLRWPRQASSATWVPRSTASHAEFIPRPEPDELLYSVVARGVEMAGRSAAPQILAACTGSPSGAVAVDLPTGIGRMLDALPDCSPGDGEAYVDRYTMFPYMLRFAGPATRTRVRAALLRPGGRRPAKLGVMARAFPFPPVLRACAACIQADAGRVGMAWWRRVHQLPAVFLCPVHGLPLQRTAVPRLGLRGARGVVALHASLLSGPDFVLPPDRTRSAFLSYAQASAQMLELQWPRQFDPAALGACLRELLADFRWSRAPSLLDSSSLVRAFMSHARIRPVLAAMQAELTEDGLVNALNRLLYGHGSASHPLLVLIILELAGGSLADVAASMEGSALHPITPADEVALAADAAQSPAACVRHPGMVRQGLECRDPCAAVPGGPAPGDLGRSTLDGCAPEMPGLVDGHEPDRLLVEMLAGGASVRAVARRLRIAPTSVQRHARRLGRLEVRVGRPAQAPAAGRGAAPCPAGAPPRGVAALPAGAAHLGQEPAAASLQRLPLPAGA